MLDLLRIYLRPKHKGLSAFKMTPRRKAAIADVIRRSRSVVGA